MTRIRRFSGLAALVISGVALICGSAASAASGQGQARVKVGTAVRVVKTADLDFGDFAAGTTTTRFILNAATNTLTKQGGGNALPIGGTPAAASFTASGLPLLRVRITVNNAAITLVRNGGTETMRVDRLRLDGGNGTRNRFLNALGNVTYKVGGRLTIGAAQRDGAYRGTFGVTIDYQ
ncbi:MAG: DUF4402 domain-containing protein [Parasphingorhabdus sp.]|nr:DUF4402 domain-containing protein [Parasphingorhabdus sp.]